jgi:hypothetical protein
MRRRELPLGGVRSAPDTRAVATDDPELQAAMARYAERDRPGPFHVVFTVLLLGVHLILLLVALYVVAMSAMWTDNCAYVACGDDQWINRAMEMMLAVGGALLVIDAVAKARKAMWVPLLGCAAQVGISVLAAYMISLAGPL